MVDKAKPHPIRIESPFGSLVTNSVKLGKFARELLEIAEQMHPDNGAEPLKFKIGEIECSCHPDGASMPDPGV